MIGRRGFTLIELMVALTVSGMVMLSGYGALSVMIDHRARVMNATDEAVSAARERAMLVEWLRSAHSPVEGDTTFQGVHGMDMGKPDDALTFITNAPTPLGAGETIVRLYVDRDDRTSARGLCATLTDWNTGANQQVQIDPRVTGLSIEYLGPSNRAQVWRQDWRSTPIQPVAVRITIYADPVDKFPDLLAAPITVAIRGAE